MTDSGCSSPAFGRSRVGSFGTATMSTRNSRTPGTWRRTTSCCASGASCIPVEVLRPGAERRVAAIRRISWLDDFTAFGELLGPDADASERFAFANEVRARLLSARRRVARFAKSVMAD